MRIKRQELSHAIQAEGSRVSRPAHQLLHPTESGVKLIKSRLAATAQSTVRSVASLKEIPTRVKAVRQKQKVLAPRSSQSERSEVTPPKSSWRERLSSAYSQASKGVSSVAEDIQKRLERPTPPPAPIAPKPGPKIQLKKVETTAGKIQSFVKKRSQESPLKQARQILQERQYSKAEDLLVPYIVKHPKSAPAYMLLGEAAIGREAWDEAIEVFEQVLRIDTEASDANAQLGLAAMKAGQFTRALEALQRAQDADPENVLVLKNLLTIAQRMDNKVLQKSVLQQLIVLTPDDPEVHSAAEALEEKERQQTPAA